MPAPLIQSGSFEDDAFVTDYRAEHLGDVLVELIVWRDDTPDLARGQTVVRGGGYVWYRFWLPAYNQVVERYFRGDGTPAGTLVDLCAPLECDAEGCSTVDFLLDIWVDPGGLVTVYNEAAYDAAVREGLLTAEQAKVADRHLREITAAIARGRFPPPLVRNWRMDPARVRGGDG